MILGICDNPSVLEVMNIISKIIMIIKIAVPIILIVIVMIDFMKCIKVGDEDLLKKAQRMAINRAIAAVLIFLVPTFVGTLVRISTNGTEYQACFSENISETTKEAYIANAERIVSKAESTLNYNDYNNAIIAVNNIKDASDRLPFQERLNAIKDKINDRISENEEDDNPNPPSDNNDDEDDETVVAKKDNTIYIGDSRINRMKAYVSLKSNESTIAKDGANITNVDGHFSTLKSTLNSNSTKSYNIFLAYGINDLYNSSKYCTKYQNLVDSIDSKHNVIIVSVIPVSRSYTSINNNDVTSFNNKIKSCVSGKNVSYCDAASKATIETWEKYFDDGVHYNKVGSEFYYSKINECIK